MLVDDVQIKIKAGDGGDGAVAFNKNLMELGPAGGSGGRGGDVYIEGVSDLSKLNQFRYKKSIIAQDGQGGRTQFRDGIDGEDVVLEVPVGTVVEDLSSGVSHEVLRVGERIRIAKGGNGGRGNFHFRSSTNTSPKEFEKGKKGDEFDARLQLKFIADVGLIGLPNVGKSSLLNELTNAKSKVANYQFTTLEPNLGVYYELILADIPGLIEGASEGKGLGYKFLRHIERTDVLFHLISAQSQDPAGDHEAVHKELAAYSKKLAGKKEYVFISKSDEVNEKRIDEIARIFKKKKINTYTLSILDEKSLDEVKKILNELIKNKKSSA